MSNDDNQLASAMWLVAGGAAGYVAGRYVVGPLFSMTPAHAAPLASSSTAVASAPAPRALGAGPSGAMQPIDPYGPTVIDVVATPSPHAGPSGDMRPIDPYADAAPSIAAAPAITSPTTSPPAIAEPSVAPGPSVATTPVIATSPSITSPSPTTPKTLDGPITMPSQVEIEPHTRPTTTGPITRPSQVEASSSRPTEVSAPVVATATTQSAPALHPVFATKPRVRRFDPVFQRYRGELPIEYVRALVERESDGLPKARTGSAIGLMQIVPIVLSDYNKRHGTAYRSEHLTDPAINVAIGCELLRLIVKSYRKHHPRIATLHADWNNLRFVELLTFGWNAGYSEAGGLGRVARYLERLGAVDITIDQVSAHAKLAGATKHLSNPAKVAWCKGVAALYQRERALARAAFASS
ncbi:MAG: transglycosylase SLT domain-containing protein [Kofleriaceae bacterium]|nr:transglycosylase SLT domain-containing protein [Kofleriaceae bacterium]